MTIQGFLDFQEGTIWQSDLAFNVSNLAQATGTTITSPASGTFVCSNWQATQLRCTTGLGIVDYTAQWFRDSAGLNQVGERRWSVYDGWPLPTYITLGNLGSYLKIQTTNNSGGNTNAFCQGIFTNRPLGPFQSAFSTPMLDTQALNVAGGATVTLTANYLFAGPAYYWLFTQAAVWFANLVGVTSNGTTHFVSHVGNADEYGAAQDRHEALILPALPIRLQFTNNDAGFQPLFVALNPDAFR